MPPRRIRTRKGEAADLELWRETFDTGCDFFGDLGDAIVGSPSRQAASRASEAEAAARGWRAIRQTPEAERKAQVALYDAARAAWGRLGVRFMAEQPAAQETQPWALLEFGGPDA